MLLTVQRQWDCDLGLYKIKLISFDCKMGWCFQIKDFWAQVTPDEVPVYFSCLRERCTNILLWSSRNAFWTQEASLGFPSTWVESDCIFLFFFFFSVNLFFKDKSGRNDLFSASKAGLHTFKRSFPGSYTSISRICVWIRHVGMPLCNPHPQL